MERVKTSIRDGSAGAGVEMMERKYQEIKVIYTAKTGNLEIKVK